MEHEPLILELDDFWSPTLAQKGIGMIQNLKSAPHENTFFENLINFFTTILCDPQATDMSPFITLGAITLYCQKFCNKSDCIDHQIRSYTWDNILVKTISMLCIMISTQGNSIFRMLNSYLS